MDTSVWTPICPAKVLVAANVSGKSLAEARRVAFASSVVCFEGIPEKG